MPTIQTRNQDLEKRLAHLRSQLHGKKLVNQQISRPAVQPTSSSADTSVHQSADLVYLRHDLLKIFILAGLAFAFQFSLYFLLKNHLLNIKLP